MNTNTIRIFAISGSDEYHSSENLQRLKTHLEKVGGYKMTISEAGDRGHSIPGISELPNHDILLVFCKRLELSPTDLIPIMKWCWNGNPVVGIRTASHAFQTWKEFDAEILGGSYSGHGSEEMNLVRAKVEESSSHPVLSHLDEWSTKGKIYYNKSLAAECIELMQVTNSTGKHPVAWVRTVPQSRGRVFYTSLGETGDFERAAFLKLLQNSIDWAACRTGAYTIKRLMEIPAVKCPCGFSRRAFTESTNPLATLHMVDITEDSASHYHRKLTELYLIIEGEGHVEINGESIPVGPLDALLIERGCRHRAKGNLRIVNIPIPSFDSDDEWFD